MSKFFIALSGIIFLLFSCSSDALVGQPDNESDEINESSITVSNVKTFMVDQSAADQTAALFYNLYKNAGSKILLGHQDAFYSYYQNDNSMSDVKKTTGSDPALIGLDFMFITDKNYQQNPSNWFYQQEQKIISAAQQAYDKGMTVTFCWHLREPFSEEHFYTSEMTDSQKKNAFKSILPNGTNHFWYKQKLDKIASVVKNLKGSNSKTIPIIFRPFHEMDGNWFWWGSAYCTPEEYKELWQFTVHYLRDIKEVHNFLYAFSPDANFNSAATYLERYPGDQYVDILGMDNYLDFSSQTPSGASAANSKLKIISDLALQKNKIAALTETGYSSGNATPRIAHHFTSLLYPAITNNNIKIAYVNFWSNTASQYYVPTLSSSFSTDFKNFSHAEKITLQNNIETPIYQFP